MEDNIKIKQQSIFLIRQRNFFAACMGMVIIANFLLVGKLSVSTEKIIMVPGISKDLVIEGTEVSQSYLEETALLFASALLDLTPDTIDLKKNIILKHTSNRSKDSMQSLQQYFAASKKEHKKFGLSTFFSLKKMYVDNKKLQVIVEGLLTSTFGKRGFEQDDVKYLLSFDYDFGHLKLKEFVKIKDKSEEKSSDIDNEQENKI